MSDRTRRPRPARAQAAVPFTIEKVLVHGTPETEAQDEAAFCDAFELMLELHKDGGYAKLNTEKAAGIVYDVFRQGMTFIARLDEAPLP